MWGKGVKYMSEKVENCGIDSRIASVIKPYLPDKSQIGNPCMRRVRMVLPDGSHRDEDTFWDFLGDIPFIEDERFPELIVMARQEANRITQEFREKLKKNPLQDILVSEGNTFGVILSLGEFVLLEGLEGKLGDKWFVGQEQIDQEARRFPWNPIRLVLGPEIPQE